MAFDRRQLNRATLARQILLRRDDLAVDEAVRRLYALQAQEALPPYVGLWTRVDGFRREALHAALHDRVLVRATSLRGTLHVLTAADYGLAWGALQPMLTDGLRILGDRRAGLDVDATVAAARRHLAGGPLTFNELRPLLVEDFPDVNDRALGYVARLQVPLVMVPTEDRWSFPSVASFTLADAWLGRPITADTAPASLVPRYLAAFGPATVADFQAWSGLTRMKPVFESLRHELEVLADERGRELFDLPGAPRPDADTPAPVRYVPDFDNLLLAHDDRSRVVADEHRGRVVTKNLRVNATFLVDGFVAGLWRVDRKRKVATLTLQPFAALPRRVEKELTTEGEALLRFLEPDASTLDIHVEAA